MLYTMRTRKHQSPVDSGWMDKHNCENGTQLTCEAQATAAKKGTDATNGIAQHEPTENALNVDLKKVNGKKQKRRRRSPKNKAVMPKVDSALFGLMADTVWLDKYLYDEAECDYHAKLAAAQAKVLENRPNVNVASVKERRSMDVAARKKSTENCAHSTTMACHHVDNGVWVNKFSFDDAESRFIIQFASPLAPRALNLNLVSHERAATRSTQRTPDEGYSSATPTPAACDLLTVNEVISDPTVNGKPQWATVQDLLSEVWLDKSQYDQAEQCFYEHAANTQTTMLTQSDLNWSMQSGKKGKRDRYNRKSAGRQQPKKKELASIPEESANSVYYPAYFLHRDSESTWLNKTAYDIAEACFYAAQEVSVTVQSSKSTSTKLPRPIKPKHQDKNRKMAASCLSTENIWFDKCKYDDAERQYYEDLSKAGTNAHIQPQEDGASTILRDIARARENIQKSLAGSTAAAPNGNGDNSDLLARVANLEHENQNLHKVVKDLQLVISKLESRIGTLEKTATSDRVAPALPSLSPFRTISPGKTLPARPAPVPKKVEEEEEEDDDDDDDIDLFGSDEEEDDGEAARIRDERVKQYAEKKSKKPGLIAKSSILLDVKPWDDETDMAKLEECVRTVQMDGLLWGSSKLVPVGYGIKKLQIQCVVEDDKVGTDMLEEEITKFEDYVQSVDIAAFNKI
ncbi:PREDICTED: elongation factor 1-delta [Nanorana parkeri]|uniref:elongation factor 1-delta n=1 Tax=Nanorana parkeri TaxID=125878 RepID=UPI000854D5DD|nr:PREDICTED: elongation factor 1-delta [Nanorana parkeri]